MIKLFEQLQRKSARLLIGSTLFAVAAIVGMPAPASAWSEWGRLESKKHSGLLPLVGSGY
jgi:hypothetical protein